MANKNLISEMTDLELKKKLSDCKDAYTKKSYFTRQQHWTIQFLLGLTEERLQKF